MQAHHFHQTAKLGYVIQKKRVEGFRKPSTLTPEPSAKKAHHFHQTAKLGYVMKKPPKRKKTLRKRMLTIWAVLGFRV